MSVEGEVCISLHASGGVVQHAEVSSRRPLLAARLLQNQQPQAAVNMVSSLYRICSAAQACASVRAMEQALSSYPAVFVEQTRMQILHMETLREHSWRILLDWPLLSGDAPDQSAMKRILEIDRAWRQAVDGSSQVFQIAGEGCTCDAEQAQTLLGECGDLLARSVFSMPLDRWLAMQHVEDFQHWAEKGESAAARLMKTLLRRGWAETGKSDIQALPHIGLTAWQDLLDGQGAEYFMHAPELAGEQYETTPFSRQSGHPLLHSLVQVYGNGLLTRLTAVLVELARMYCDLVAWQGGEMPEGLFATTNVDSDLRAGSGIGVVEAARGRLVHRVRIADERISEYQIVAPTEWNFHPQGALARSMRDMSADDDKGLEVQAKLLIHALDPCVRFSLQVNGHA